MDVFSEILKPEVQRYIRSQDVQRAFSHGMVKNPFPEIPFSILMNQIKGIIKSKNKLPQLNSCEKIIYPEGISMEQCSSSHTATYKASLIGKINRGADLTGGFGVDSMAFAEKSETWDYFEINENLSHVVHHNMAALGYKNITVHPEDGIKHILNTGKTYDFIYSDPARRDENASRVYGIEDCTPDMSVVQDALLNISPILMTKLSPMLDINKVLEIMRHVSEIHIVGVRGEVKEVLLIQKRDFKGIPTIFSADFTAEKKEPYVFSAPFQSETIVEVSAPQAYIYDTSATMRKASLSDAYAIFLGLKKLNVHTSLYTSNECKSELCGRVFEVKSEVNKKTVSSFLPDGKANVICRNFPQTPSFLQKKWKIKDGGDGFILAFKDNENKYRTLYADKVKFL